MIDEELNYLMNELETRIRMLKDVIKRLNDKLHALATPMPELPDKPGYYLTQQHMLLLRDMEGDWLAFDGESGHRKRFYWNDRNVSGYSITPQEVCDRLGLDAFPLVPISEVILPTKEETK